ncbi:MAG: hypothetical protein B7Y37_03755 [Sphingobacteriia bacterium 28-36-52]|nr:MAG: hypothetical protein B7Y37_03755 [Sphingobacteriia bacterium 28-36-52]
MKKLLGLLLGLLVTGSVFSEDIDSVFTLKNSPFFTDLIRKKHLIQPLRSSEFNFIKPQFKHLKTRRYQFFKSGQDFFIHFNGSGFLYQLENPTDSVLTFKRIDDTENYNYNIEAFLFTHQKEIYNIGGYGFWRSSGTLRKYNHKDQEWDAEPIDQEIHLPYVNQLGTSGQLTWFNTNTEHLYIPFQTIINSGVKSSGEDDEIVKKVYRLSLATKTWKKLGKTHPDYFDLLQKTKWVLATDSGQLICFNHKVYQINFEENIIKENTDPSLAQSLERINNDHLVYYDNQTIYYLNGKTWQYDSVKVDTAKFEKANFKVWKKNNGFVTFWIILVVLFSGAAGRKEIQKRRKKLLEDAANKIPISPSVKIKFNETEKQLLNLLLEKSKQNSTTTITEINYVLGIKDKNVGLQKKVRSDVMKSINEKFNFLQDGDTELVCNIRSQADKRFFEYYIDKENIELLEIMLREES